MYEKITFTRYVKTILNNIFVGYVTQNDIENNLFKRWQKFYFNKQMSYGLRKLGIVTDYN